jgi:galactose mutarotase-like enzyme
MYAIALKQKQYPTYILSDADADARLEVVPERGGIITQWHIQDTQILYFDAERFSDPSQSVRGGIPILFPICGNLPDNTYLVENQPYSLKQHGFARDLPWTVSDRGVKDGPEGGAVLQLTLSSSEATRQVYPFDFELTFTYRLMGNRLFIEQRFYNSGDRPMPFCSGLHPYFQLNATPTAKSQLQLNIPAAQYTDQISQRDHAYNGSLDWSSPELDLAFRPISAPSASVRDLERQVEIALSYDSPYSTLVFWAVAEKNYYCLEPWSAPRNALNTGIDLLTLAPGETQVLNVTLSATRLTNQN